MHMLRSRYALLNDKYSENDYDYGFDFYDNNDHNDYDNVSDNEDMTVNIKASTLMFKF